MTAANDPIDAADNRRTFNSRRRAIAYWPKGWPRTVSQPFASKARHVRKRGRCRRRCSDDRRLCCGRPVLARHAALCEPSRWLPPILAAAHRTCRQSFCSPEIPACRPRPSHRRFASHCCRPTRGEPSHPDARCLVSRDPRPSQRPFAKRSCRRGGERTLVRPMRACSRSRWLPSSATSPEGADFRGRYCYVMALQLHASRRGPRQARAWGLSAFPRSHVSDFLWATELRG